MRRLFLSPALLALVACDDAPLAERPDADAFDSDDAAELGGSPLDLAGAPLALGADLDARRDVPPVVVVAARPDARPAPADPAAALLAVQPLLDVVPGLAASLARGELAAPHDDLSLPAGVAELSGAPWLLVDGQLVLAQLNAIEPAWSAGAPRLVEQPGADDDGGLFVARRPLAAAALPAAFKTLVGATVKVFDHEREVCVAKVDGLALEARLVHKRDAWMDEELGRPQAPTHDATAVFEQGLPMLVAELAPIGAGDCGHGVWATPVASPTPTLFRATPTIDKSLSRLAVRAFRKHPDWAARQHDFATFYNDEQLDARPTTRWDANAEHVVRRFLAHDGGREVVAVSADTWDGCGSNGQRMTALFEVVRTDGKPTLEAIAARPWSDIPAGLVDLTGDGTLELLGDGVVYRWHDAGRPASAIDEDAGYEELERVSVPDLTAYGCGC